jgi:hypothetical protein
MPLIAEARVDSLHAPNDAPLGALLSEAGEFAHAIARVYPRPHSAYFAAELSRRRLMALIAERARGEFDRLREPLAVWSLKRLISAYLPFAPDGLAEALRKLQGAWRRHDYERLFQVLADQKGGAKLLRHAAAIDADLVRRLDMLPVDLRRVRIVALAQNAAMTGLVARGAKRVVKLAGQSEEMAHLGERLERARTRPQLFRMLIEAVGLEQLAPPPIPGSDWFVPLASARQIESAALRFQNCLKGRIPWLLRGCGAYYEIVGDEPAIVEIVRSESGLWMVGEVRGHANVAISASLWSQVRVYLERHGAQVERTRLDPLTLALVEAAGW